MHLVLGFKKIIFKLRMSLGMAKCSDYCTLIQLVVDNEASKSEEKYLKEHLDICVKCLGLFDVDAELKKAIKLRMEHIEVPKDLAETIKNKINQSA